MAACLAVRLNLFFLTHSTVTLGGAEKIQIGCTQIRVSTMEEINSFTVGTTPSKVQDLLLTSTLHYEDMEPASKMIANPCITCDPVNPHSSSFKTVEIHNFRYNVVHGLESVSKQPVLCYHEP